MAFYLPFVGAFFEASLAILLKKIFNKNSIDFRHYLSYTFGAIVLVSLPLIYFLFSVDDGAMRTSSLILFGFMILVSILANYFMFYSLKHKDLAKIEPIRLMQPLFVILMVFGLSFFFSIYESEGNYLILGLALVASLSLVLAHIRKDHFVFDKYLVAALFSSLFFGIEFVISRPLLEFYSPFTFYFIRSLVIFFIGWTFFHPNFVPLKNETKWLFLITGIGAVVYRVILYYGYLTLGVIYTTTVFIMAPVLVYIFAAMFLKEKITKRQIVSSVVIVACVVAAVFVGG